MVTYRLLHLNLVINEIIQLQPNLSHTLYNCLDVTRYEFSR